ncbi:MAG: DDE-type integrase/transposase/recombinase [Desulfobulbaceae bacterium]|nr:DDE-type integrase/transposase/recombinase [Desulfobulbaceae bacterium]
MMDDKQREEIALFRYGIISDLVGSRLEHGEFAKLIRDKSNQRWSIPFSHRTSLSQNTIRRWVTLYETNGKQLLSLYPSSRSDSGKSRKVDDETILSLVKLRREKPSLPVNRLIEEMKQKNLITPGISLHLSTAYRILKNEGLSKAKVSAKVDRRRFEAEFPNDIWQSDVMHGPHVMINGKNRKSYLIAFLDDHSRLLPCAEFYSSERLDHWLDAFRKALLTRGMPRKLYVDNGAAFRSRHLERICASLGITLIHTPPYTPQGRGKIERFFRTVRSQLLSSYHGKSLDDLNTALNLWVDKDYHQRNHSSTGQSPFNRFVEHLELLRAAPADMEDHFRKEVRRRVTKDRTVSINNRLYEAPVQLIGEQVSLLFHEHKPERVEVMFQGESYGNLLPVDLTMNSTVKREKDVTDVHKPGGLPF